MEREPGSESVHQPPRQAPDAWPSKEALDMFKFYEEAAEKAKQHAWSATTWILALNAGILAFAFDFFGKNFGRPGFVVLEIASAIVGLGLSGFLVYLLYEAGRHIRHYWTSANTIAAFQPSLESFIGANEAEKVRQARKARIKYEAGFPAFCLRLQLLAALFALVHVGTAAFLVYLAMNEPAGIHVQATP